MKHLKRIDEAVGTILERRASAETLLKAVVKGNTTEVEGIELSKQMAQGFLDWLQYSTYGKKFGALPFYKLFTASFNWGLDRFVKGANTQVKGEFKELKAKAKEMSKAEMNKESVVTEAKMEKEFAFIAARVKEHDLRMKIANELFPKIAKKQKDGKFVNFKPLSQKQRDQVLDELVDRIKDALDESVVNEANSTLNVANAAVLKADVPLSYARDYIDSLTRMSKRDKKKFKEYDNFSEDDFIEDVEYNMANENNLSEGTIIDLRLRNESKDFKPHMMYDPETGEEYKAEKPEDHERMSKLGYVHEKPESVDEAKFKNTTDFEKFLIEIDGMGESQIKKIMGKDYIDTPGYYKDEKGNYDGVEEFMLSNMGTKEYDKLEKYWNDNVAESLVDEARFVKSYDKRLDNAKTKEEVLKLYPKAEFFVGKSDHFFGELEPNLFFKSYYTKGQKEFNIKSVYSKKGSNYVHLYNKIGESVVNESASTEEKKIATRAIRSIAKYLNRDLALSAQYLINAAEEVKKDIEKGKIK